MHLGGKAEIDSVFHPGYMRPFRCCKEKASRGSSSGSGRPPRAPVPSGRPRRLVGIYDPDPQTLEDTEDIVRELTGRGEYGRAQESEEHEASTSTFPSVHGEDALKTCSTIAPSDDFELINITLVGDFKVGKTSLLSKFVGRNASTEHFQSIGVDFCVKTLTRGGKKVRVKLSDTAGQEEFSTRQVIHYLQRF